MFDIGGGELLLIVLVVLILFGPKKIPEVAQLIGRGVQKARRAQEEFIEQVRTINSTLDSELKPIADEAKQVGGTIARLASPQQDSASPDQQH
ncbi:MAG: twin-arginine translocase TatA/TatE family subunit [Chlorobi bacterium]|nr:twin-arginine translocase TatA/TatE family subunit [Chlorobiota bacterium]